MQYRNATLPKKYLSHTSYNYIMGNYLSSEFYLYTRKKATDQYELQLKNCINRTELAQDPSWRVGHPTKTSGGVVQSMAPGMSKRELARAAHVCL